MAGNSWKGAIAAGSALIAAYYVVADGVPKDVVYLAIGLASAVCVEIGVRWHRPANRREWRCLAAATLFFVAGDTVPDVYDLYLHRELPFPSIADALYLAGYPFMFAAMLGIGSVRGAGMRERRADAAIVCTGAMAIFWQFLMGTYAHDATLNTVGKLVTMAYPMMDLGLLYIIVGALLSGRARQTADSLLAIAVLVLLGADFVYDLLILHGTYTPSSPVNAAFLMEYVLVGAAALHPSMARTARDDDPPKSPRRGRLPLVASAGLASPLMLLIGTMRGWQEDVTALAGTSIALFVLVLLRMHWMVERIVAQSKQLQQRTQSLEAALSTQMALEGDLRYQASHDGLTNLPNRALLRDRVDEALARHARTGTTFALCICDIDGFKAVNDSLGHHVGDELLITIGKRLAAIVRSSDTAARLGGDEFALLIEGIDDVGVATEFVGRVVAAIRQPVSIDGRVLAVSASVGIAFAELGTTTAALMSEADAAMYAAKADGKDRYAVFAPAMRTRIVAQLQLRSAFQGALQRKEFHLDYQPQLSLSDGKLQGFEALIRWNHPELGLISPDRFISLAEETGFIVPLGRWVLETACMEAATWNSIDGPLSVAVNLSARQMIDCNLVTDVSAVLAYSGLSPDQLVLEITESVLMIDPTKAAESLAQFRAMGIRIAIDDFGTGYSSLSYLRQFPVDILKIDRSFVNPLADPASEGAAFIRAILRLARDLNLSTCAEGIETTTQLAALTELKCSTGQGYLLSRPLPSDRVASYISDFERESQHCDRARQSNGRRNLQA